MRTRNGDSKIYDKGRETRELNRTGRSLRGTRDGRHRLFKVRGAHTRVKEGMLEEEKKGEKKKERRKLENERWRQ